MRRLSRIDYADGSNAIKTEVGQNQRRGSNEGCRSLREGTEDATLLALTIGKGVTSQAMKVASRS